MFQRNKFLTYLNICNTTVNGQPEAIPVAAINKMEANARRRHVNLVIDYKHKPEQEQLIELLSITYDYLAAFSALTYNNDSDTSRLPVLKNRATTLSLMEAQHSNK